MTDELKAAIAEAAELTAKLNEATARARDIANRNLAEATRVAREVGALPPLKTTRSGARWTPEQIAKRSEGGKRAWANKTPEHRAEWLNRIAAGRVAAQSAVQ